MQGPGPVDQGYYKWLKGPVPQRDYDDAHAINALWDIHLDDPTLGYRFLTDELADVGITASENRVWRLCSVAGIFASHARKKSKVGKPGPPVHDDLLAFEDEKGMVRHDFTATAPNQKWLTDMQCRRRHWTSYADLRTMPMLSTVVQVIDGSGARKVGMVLSA